MNDNQPTTKQIVVFAVVLSFVVSIIGTILTLGTLGSFSGGEGTVPFIFNRPQTILEKITEQIANSNSTSKVNEEPVVKVVQQASPAVVSVVASKDVPVLEQYFVDPFGNDPYFKQFFGDNGSGFQIPQYRQNGTKREDVSAGSGFIVSADGLIVTNKHVVADTAADYTVLLNDGSKKPAKVLARDPIQDLAVVKIEGSSYPTVTLGDSAAIKIGQTAIAIGNALGEFRNTVSTGVVSGLQRSIVADGAAGGTEALQELIQTDAAINPGNSGGPLLNLDGQVVGINTAIAQGAQNIGFAIPINKVKRDLDNVRAKGKITYPYLGVRYVTVTQSLVDSEKLGRNYGALVRGSETESAVIADSPAERAGIHGNDIILQVNGERIQHENTLSSLIQKHQVGDEVTLRIFRSGNEFDVKVKLDEMPPQ